MRMLVVICMMLGLNIGARACAVCGSSAGNQNLGILPQFHKHFAGLQYQYREFESRHDAVEGSTAEVSREYYQTLQVWGRAHVGRRLQLFAFVPYIYNRRVEPHTSSTVSGMGDLTLLANVTLLRQVADKDGWQYQLQAGGGVKMPTGHYDANSVRKADGLPNMQPGTDSWDFVANANQTTRFKNVGYNIDVSYTLTTPNSTDYKFGNRFSAGMLAFYWLEAGSFTLLPQAGVRLDVAGPDYDNYAMNWKNDMSGGHQLYASAGIQAYHKRKGFQLMLLQPATQHFASGMVKARFRAEGGMFFLF